MTALVPRETEIPAWVGRYVGIPWADRGRTREGGVDCWGLVCLVYAERLGIRLSELEYSSAEDPETVTAAIKASLGAGGPGWTQMPPEQARPYDVALYRARGRPWHVGVIVAPNRVLHMPPRQASLVERMDGVSLARRLCGVYRLAILSPVRVAGRERPFGPRIDAEIPAGGNVVEILVAAGLEPFPGLKVFVGGVEVPYDAWPHVRPKPGRAVTVAAVPEGGGAGGGKTALRIIATIALIAAGAAAFGALTAPVAQGGLGLSQTGAALIVGAGTIGVSLAIAALAPPPKPKLDQAQTTSPTIAGARNAIRPYAPWPDVLGFHRLVPPFAAAPYTEIAGDDQYLRLLFDCGYGPKELTDIRIGETPIEEFDGIELEVRAGHMSDDPIRLFPDVVHEDPLQILLEQAAGWQVRTTAPDADEISVDVTFPAGLARITSDGERAPLQVALEVEYSDAGTGKWRKVNGDADGGLGSPVNTRQLDYLVRTPEARVGQVGFHHTASIAWGLGFPNPKPLYLPERYFSWVAEGWFRDDNAPENGGDYVFGIDCSDAGDLEIDGRVVCSWYGGHPPADGDSSPPNFAPHASATVRLVRGYHRIRVRVECRSTTGAVAIGWRTPSNPAWTIMPAAVFRTRGSHSDGVQGLIASWYDTSVYRSSIVVNAETTTALRRSLAWAVPRGQYDVRVRRVTEDYHDARSIDDVYWTALRAITNEHPINAPGRALVAARIKATDQLNGVIDNLSVMVRSVVPDYDAATGQWIERATNNPASLYRYLLQGRINGRPLPDSRIDLAELVAWHADCVANGWAFNAVLDFDGTILERLQDVAAAGRASPGMREGLYSVVRDRPQSTPVQVITPRNSFGFRGRKIFAEEVHALRVQFLNERIGYQRDERVVLNDGYQIRGLDAFGRPAPELPPATKYETIDLFGVTDPDLAWKHGRYHLAVAKLRPELVEVGMDVEHLACTRGDLVLCSHYAWGETRSQAARVLSLETDSGGSLTGIYIDEEVVMDEGESYGVRVRRSDGSIFTAALAPFVGITNYLRFAGPISAGQPWPAAGDLAVFGLLGLETREMIVQAIDTGPDLSARITLVDHAPAVHLADQGEIPPFDSGIRNPPVYQDGPETPVIERIQSDDWVMVRQADGSFEPRMVITLRRPSSQRPIPVEAEVGLRPYFGGQGPLVPYHYRRLPLINSQVVVDQVQVGTTYDIRLRTITRIGQASAPVLAVHTVQGNVLPPPDVVSFAVTQLPDGTRRYSWDLGPIPPDIAGVIIRYAPVSTQPDWDRMEPLHTGILDAASPQELMRPEGGNWNIGIKMVDTAGNESVNARIIDVTLSGVFRPDLIRSEDARALNWPGTLVDCTRVRARLPRVGLLIRGFGIILEAIDDTTWDDLASLGVTQWDHWQRWIQRPRSPIAYEHTMDCGAVLPMTVYAFFECVGDGVMEIFWSRNGNAWEGPITPEQARQQMVVARYVRARLTVTATQDALIAQIRELRLDCRGVVSEHFVDNLNTSTLTEGFRLGVGDFRVPLPPGEFAAITHVNLTFNGIGAGYTYVLVDRLSTPGPRVRIFGPDHQPADAVVDVWVRGFAGEVEELAATQETIFAAPSLSALLGAV